MFKMYRMNEREQECQSRVFVFGGDGKTKTKFARDWDPFWGWSTCVQDRQKPGAFWCCMASEAEALPRDWGIWAHFILPTKKYRLCKGKRILSDLHKHGPVLHGDSWHPWGCNVIKFDFVLMFCIGNYPAARFMGYSAKINSYVP